MLDLLNHPATIVEFIREFVLHKEVMLLVKDSKLEIVRAYFKMEKKKQKHVQELLVKPQEDTPQPDPDKSGRLTDKTTLCRMCRKLGHYARDCRGGATTPPVT